MNMKASKRRFLRKRRYPFLFSSTMKGFSTKQTCSLPQSSIFTSKFLPSKQTQKLFFFSIFSFGAEHQLPRGQKMWQKQSQKSSYKESLKALEAHIQHANRLAAALPKDFGGDCVQMKLGYSPVAPLILFLIEWMDYSCRDVLPSYLGLLHILIYKVYVDGMPTLSFKERKVTVREFYAVVYPSLKQLEGELNECNNPNSQPVKNKIDEVDECGICMENCTKMVLPNCGHSLCIMCFHDWYLRSQSCPFCRGNLSSVGPKDLWVLTSNNDIIDTTTLAKHNLRRFYLYIDNLPLLIPEMHSFLHDYMI